VEWDGRERNKIAPFVEMRRPLLSYRVGCCVRIQGGKSGGDLSAVLGNGAVVEETAQHPSPALNDCYNEGKDDFSSSRRGECERVGPSTSLSPSQHSHSHFNSQTLILLLPLVHTPLPSPTAPPMLTPHPTPKSEK